MVRLPALLGLSGWVISIALCYLARFSKLYPGLGLLGAESEVWEAKLAKTVKTRRAEGSA
jgi:hypothetical protein